MSGDIESEIEKLEKRAAFLQGHLDLAPRAFAIEFAGTPKAGKSTTVEAIRHFFTRSGFRVHVLIERASVCPIPMKGHLFFNIWCACTMLAEMLANIEADADILIIDRGILDALVWLTLQKDRGELTKDEANTIESFLLLDRWRGLIDLAVVMNVDPVEAIEREKSQRISAKTGSIMNVEVLERLSNAVKEAAARYRPHFGKIIEAPTSGLTVRESSAHLATEILDNFEAFLNPEILVVPRAELAKLPLKDGGAFDAAARDEVTRCILQFGKFVRRIDAEDDREQVQIVACGILMRESNVFVFERKDRDPKSSLYGKATLWQGGHVAKQDGKGGIDLLKSALLDRITRSLFMSRVFTLDFVGYCWDPTNEQSSRHFGVMFRVNVDNEEAATDLRKKEFRHGRGHGLAGKFVSWSEIENSDLKEQLEPWSLALLVKHEAVVGLQRIE